MDGHPQSVADLGRDPAWQVSTTTDGRWVLAEREFRHGGHHWQIGLTPVAPGVAAVMLWRDGAVVEHARGTEAEACATAATWQGRFASG
ncbi:hypothetical protein [Amycolatopsis sp.]|uniref:hypothetical protein n=1 Tax=Amycolatopsis sp. TaxID=37632 RepID=UPI002CA909EB|nr:hypothetical protein [Amycolatopsis sp.]HVV11899.1 hypothetical protein [Amycolatopsis sp.]